MHVRILRGLLAFAPVVFAVVWLSTTSDDSLFGEGPVDVHDPVRAGEQTPAGFSQLLPRDAIFPVYSPTFRDAEATSWPDETLVIGVEMNDEAKAYPVSFLNRREMVIDWIGGSPVLVSW